MPNLAKGFDLFNVGSRGELSYWTRIEDEEYFQQALELIKQKRKAGWRAELFCRVDLGTRVIVDKRWTDKSGNNHWKYYGFYISDVLGFEKVTKSIQEVLECHSK